MHNLTIFAAVSKRYENIVSKSLNQYIRLCQDKIEKAFLVCDDSVDISRITLDVPFETMTDSDAIRYLSIDTPDYRCIVNDRWMLQQYFKLHCDVLSGSDACVVTDCDGLLLKPIRYIEDGKLNVFYSDNTFHRSPEEMKSTVRFIFGEVEADTYMFLTENVIFEKRYLEEARLVLGDMRQYRNIKTMYDLTLDEYKVLAGPSWPENPEMTDYKLFHPLSFNNVRYASLPDFVKREIDFFGKKDDTRIDSKLFFSEYEFYNYHLLLNHADTINLRYLPMKFGFIPRDNPTYWANCGTPGGREDLFDLVFNQQPMLS